MNPNLNYIANYNYIVRISCFCIIPEFIFICLLCFWSST